MYTTASIGSIFLAGLTDSYNPCSIGVLLVSLTVLLSLKQARLIALFGMSYLSAIFATYFLIGVGILRAFHLFGVHGFFGYAAGILLIVVGVLHIFPHIFPRSRFAQFIRRCHVPARVNDHIDKGVFVAGLILGFLIGLCNLPCAGGIYLGIISLLALQGSYWTGIFHLFIFNLGFILPLVLIFVCATRPAILDILKKTNARIARYGVIATSSVMILLGLVIIYYAVQG